MTMSRSTIQPVAAHPRLLITAGPTHEPIDAVRYIGNRSSGRMGIALAAEAALRDWPTTLLLGPTQLEPPTSSHVSVIRFQTTAELQELLHKHWSEHDVLIMAAAVADYRPIPREHSGADASESAKLRRSDKELTITLKPTPDLLAGIAKFTRSDQVVIGFALEPNSRLAASAREKLERKRLHAIVANPLETMDAATVSATLILRNGQEISAPAEQPKADFAAWLLDHLKDIPRC